MRYFRLFPDCHLVCGPIGATIHFLTRRETYRFSEVKSNILRVLVGNSDVETVVENHGGEARQLLAMLIREGLGTFFEKPVATEPYYPKSQWDLKGILERLPVIRSLYLQMTNVCDAKCDFCGDRDLYRCLGCNSCLRWSHHSTQRAVAEDMSKVLDELRDLNVFSVVISGGNPLMEAEQLLTLATRLRDVKPGVMIAVKCNGGHLDRKLGEKLKALDIRISFWYSALHHKNMV